MRCYICEQSVVGGTRYAIEEAIGICHQCGVGVCERHAFKSEAPGSSLMCPGCLKLVSGSDKVPEPALSTA